MLEQRAPTPAGAFLQRDGGVFGGSPGAFFPAGSSGPLSGGGFDFPETCDNSFDLDF